MTLTLTDATGRVVCEQQAVFPAGPNEWRIRREMLQGEGIYFYRSMSAETGGQEGALFLSGR